MNLMQLLLIQSVFACKKQPDIVSLIEQQPVPSIFFASFDEIDMSNMLSRLSYDSRPIKILLSENNSKFFNMKYPLFYCNKVVDSKGVTKYQSAIDISLDANQIRATCMIIDYIIKHQNSYIFSYLFKNNLIKLINRGVQISSLL